MHWRQSDAMVIIEARTLVARFQTHLLPRVFEQMRGSHLVVSAVPTAPSLHTSVSAWNGTGICICKAWAEPQSGHTPAIAPVSGLYSLQHLLPCAVSLNPNTAASPILYPLLVWTREAWLVVAPQLPQAPCSSSSFSLAWLSVMLSATMVTMAEHQVVSPLQTVS